MTKTRECDHCGERSETLTPVVNSISQSYLCPVCYAAHVAKHGAEPQLDPFARMRAGRLLA